MRTHIAAIITAAAFIYAFPAYAVAPSENTRDATVQGQADQAHQQSAATPSNSAADQRTPSQTHNKPGKHPPTAVMDRAMPSEKSAEQGGEAGKHPPSRVMERAVPEQKSPNSSASQ